MKLRITPPEEMIETEITLPKSKSMYNRAVIMRALTPGDDSDLGESPCDDATAMIEAIGTLTGDVNVDAAGTAMRFLTAYYAATPGADVTIDGCERMRKRPVGVLVGALRQCGAEIEYVGEEGFPPLRIRGRKLHGGTIDIDSGVSSQFVSALMMVAPTFDSPLTINLRGETASLPYIKMTGGMMAHRGIDVEVYGDNTVEIKPGTYRLVEADDVELDWSAASYWYSLTALSAGWVTLAGLAMPSLQGDSEVAAYYDKLGVVTASEDGNVELSASPEVFSRFDADMSDTPDVVQTVAVTCAMIGVPFHITGVKSLRIKETDRLEALKAELFKLGIEVELRRDNEIVWEGRRHPIYEAPEIDTYGDHRMAMAFAVAAVYVNGLVINDAEVVAKSYPGFWDDLRHAGFTLEEI